MKRITLGDTCYRVLDTFIIEVVVEDIYQSTKKGTLINGKLEVKDLFSSIEEAKTFIYNTYKPQNIKDIVINSESFIEVLETLKIPFQKGYLAGVKQIEETYPDCKLDGCWGCTDCRKFDAVKDLYIYILKKLKEVQWKDKR